MTSFVGNATSAFSNQLAKDDKRMMPRYFVEADPFEVVRIGASWDLLMGYENFFWPGAGRLDTPNDFILGALWHSTPEMFEPAGGGSNSRFGIIGITRDEYGSPLGGVLVKLFRTANDEKVDQIISDSFGNYLVSTPYYPEGHYLVQYKTGTPDRFGSSINTLVAG
jgi:hypothetical protein